jgi:hypothetical protein
LMYRDAHSGENSSSHTQRRCTNPAVGAREGRGGRGKGEVGARLACQYAGWDVRERGQRRLAFLHRCMHDAHVEHTWVLLCSPLRLPRHTCCRASPPTCPQSAHISLMCIPQAPQPSHLVVGSCSQTLPPDPLQWSSPG